MASRVVARRGRRPQRRAEDRARAGNQLYDDYMPQRYIDNYDMNVAPVAGMRTGWQVKFNPRTYENLMAR